MKPLPSLWFGVSILLNVAFAVWFFMRDRAAPPDNPPTVDSASTRPARSRIDANTWPNLRTEDLSTLVTRLRDAGFPSSVLRAIVAHQIGESFAMRRQAIETAAQNRPFWQNQQIDPQSRIALHQLNREHARRYREILGDEADDDHPLMNLDRGWHFSYLPAEKATQLKAVLRNFDERRQDIFSPGALLGAERDKMAALERDKREALAKILTPAELFEYDLRSSDTAAGLRHALAAFNPSEQEFRALFQAQHAFDRQWNQRWGPSTLPPQIEQARQAAYPQLWEQFKAVLGPERFAHYERATETNYQRTSLLIARLQLPPQTTEQLWAIREEFQTRAGMLNRDRTLSAEQRTAQLNALSQEATVRATPLVGGARGLEAYQQHGGSWLLSLAPPPTATTPAAPPPR
jgi:hypothetical protein